MPGGETCQGFPFQQASRRLNKARNAEWQTPQKCCRREYQRTDTQMIHKPHDAGEPLNLPAAAERLQKRADDTCRVLWSGEVGASLRAVCDLHSNCDWLARELTIVSIAAELTPLEKARQDLATILSRKGQR